MGHGRTETGPAAQADEKNIADNIKEESNMYKYQDPPVGVSWLNYPTLPIGFHWAPLGGSWYMLKCINRNM